MQVLKKTAGEAVEPTLATTPVMPDTRAVAKPFASTKATAPAEADHVKLPIWLVISAPLLNAWATNWCVWAMEKHVPAGTGSTVTEVIAGCTATLTGPLVTPAAVAVIVAVPLMGLLWASKPLQTTNEESQTPAQTLPCGEMVAILVFDELKVNVVVTLALAEFTADALIATTSPATMDNVAGLTLTAATVLFTDFEPPQPAMKDTNKTMRAIPVKSGWREFLS
jgi:hypothetical protein